jgi:O-acetyl-ADP-ribose deacetylase (regulator of RNase III)
MRNTLISIVLGDITKRPVDAIVNAANGTLQGGGGVDGAIHSAAGPERLEECRSLKGCATGFAKVTKAYRIAQVKCIVHAVGPIFGRENGREASLLASSYTDSLQLAVNYGCRSIAFPSISTGAFGYPVLDASRIALTAIRDFVDTNPGCLDLVEIATFSEGDYRIYRRAYSKLFLSSEDFSDSAETNAAPK